MEALGTGSASTTGSGNGNHGSGSSPDSSVFDPPQPSSTEHMYGGGGFPYDSGYNSSYTFPNLPNLAAQAAQAANQTVTAVSVSGGGASSVTPGSCNPDWPEYSGVDSTTSTFESRPDLNLSDPATPVSISSDPMKISEVLTNSIFEAHSRTTVVSSDVIRQHWQKGVDQTKLFAFRNMSQEDLWLTAAQRLTGIIKQIIEFAKMVPGL